MFSKIKISSEKQQYVKKNNKYVKKNMCVNQNTLRDIFLNGSMNGKPDPESYK